METAGAGINFEDCLPKLLDLRFADDILLFGPSADDFFCYVWFFAGLFNFKPLEIPTPLEGEGGAGQNQPVELHVFCLETLG